MSVENYFLPSVRRGLAAAIDGPSTNSQRAQIDVQLLVRARRKGTDDHDDDTVAKAVQLYGPGDVLSFYSRIVSKTHPEPDVGNFEANYFPAIEFAEVDFLWRYTADAARANGSLLPWLTLIVLIAEDRGDEVAREFDEGQRSPDNQLPYIHVLTKRSLPKLEHCWRWAHVHLADDTASLDLQDIETILIDEPGRAVGRLLCPRRLREKTLYNAFVVPTFELSRRAGRQLDAPDNVNALTLAWSAGDEDAIELPYYYRWAFRTGQRGDFEHLVRLLQPRLLEGVGSRTIDGSAPGLGVAGDVITLEGALRPLSLPPSAGASDTTKSQLAALLQKNVSAATHQYFIDVGLPTTTGGVHEIEVIVLRDGRSVRITFETDQPCASQVDYGETTTYGEIVSLEGGRTEHAMTLLDLEPMQTYHFKITAVPDDGSGPLVTSDGVLSMPEQLWVTPPIYGRWHKGSAQLSTGAAGSWIDMLNLEPAHRLAAGFGATVVRKNQESLMASAWEQLDEVEAANEILRTAQFGVEVTMSYHRRITRMPLEQLLQVAGPAHPRVLTTSAAGTASTIPQHISDETFVPAAAIEPATRRIAKPRGAIRRRQRLSGRQPRSVDNSVAVLERLVTKTLEAAGPHPVPGGTPRLGEATEALFNASTDVEAVASLDPSERFDEQSFDSQWVNFQNASNPFGGSGHIVYEAANALVDSATEARDDVLPVIENWLNSTHADPDNPNNTRAPRDRGFLEGVRSTVLEALRPNDTVTMRARLRLGLSPADLRRLSSKSDSEDTLDAIMAAPEFPQPMYEPLRDISQELLLPGVSQIPRNTLGLLETNRRFVESYLVGCNHELAAELLWRRYPTDQRGSYFRQFWDVGDYVPTSEDLASDGELNEAARNRLRDIAELHVWGNNSLGNNPAEVGDRANELFLLIRGDLLQRHPDTTIYAVEAVPHHVGSAEFVPGLPEYVTGYGDDILVGGRRIEPFYPYFRGTMKPDITFLGFKLPAGMDIARAADSGAGGGHGIFFIFEERATVLRFGLDVSAPPVFQTWDDLSWSHFDFGSESDLDRYLDDGILTADPVDNAERVWAAEANSATLACITVQKPVRVAVHASRMIHSDHL